MPRSLLGWFLVCWGLFLMGAVVAGAALVFLYRDGTGERIRRAETALERGCEAIAARFRFVTAGSPPIDWNAAVTHETLTAGTVLALRDLPGLEGGLWRAEAGPLAYAFPSYEGAEPKTDVPAAELPRIRAVAVAAIESGQPLTQRYEGRSQSLLMRACPINGRETGVAAWVMERVVLFGGPAYLRAALGLGLLTLVLCSSAAWLGWLLWGWSRRLGQIEAALADGGGQLPRLELTGQRDLDRVIRAVNGASERVASAQGQAATAAARAAEAERLAGLGRIAAGVAHEVRNPIAAMRLKAENALATENPERMARALQAVLVQIGRLEGVARELLGVAREGAPLAVACVDLGEMLRERGELYAEQAAAAGVTLDIGGAAPPQALIDKSRLVRSLDNLVINALQATPSGGRVTIWAEARQGAVVFGVTDTGRGVPDALRDSLFEPFATGRADGTGLGLALVREAAEAHGGTVRVIHRDQGSTFEIEIPQPEAACPSS